MGYRVVHHENIMNILLIADEKRYAWLRGRCRKYAEKHYSWQLHVDQLKSIIDELVAVKGELN